MEPLPFRFIGESSGLEFQLADHDLPTPPITWGTKNDQTVTRYGGRAASVQIHALEYEEVKLDGRIVDHWWGIDGWALNQRDAGLELAESGEVVRFEYGEDQLWGTFSIKFLERTRAEFAYELSFLPIWGKPPRAEMMSYETPPVDVDKVVEANLATLATIAANPPDGLDQESEEASSFGRDVFRMVASAQNRHARIRQSISSVGVWGQLSADVAASIVRDLRAAGLEVSRVASRARRARASRLSKAGASELAVYEWTFRLEREANRTRANMLEELRRAFESSRPSGRRIHHVRRDETLPQIAVRYYGEQSLWTRIADANDLDDSVVVVGQRLIIPEAPR